MTFSSNSKLGNIPSLIPLSVSISITSPVMRVRPFSEQAHFDQGITHTATPKTVRQFKLRLLARENRASDCGFDG